jgi:hypothetical protein
MELAGRNQRKSNALTARSNCFAMLLTAHSSNPRLKHGSRAWGPPRVRGSPPDLGKLIAEETEKWAKLVKFSGAKAD